MSRSSLNRVFGRRAKQHTIIVASGDTIRHWTIRPWIAGLATCLLTVVALGYLLATTYLVLRDDFVGAAMARQARIQHAYEDRIATLRAQVDRITSRQLLDQQQLESRMAELFQQQERLSSRHGHLDLLLQNSDVVQYVPAIVPVPTERPDRPADTQKKADARLPAQERKTASTVPDHGFDLAYSPSADTPGTAAGAVFENLLLSLRSMEEQQTARIHSLTSNAYQTAETINTILNTTGIPNRTESGVGGPLVTAENPMKFEASLDVLSDALHRLDSVRGKVRRLPLGNPAPNNGISSGFGQRRDPFLKRFAMHSGIDFRTPHGAAVLSTGRGTVVHAGRKGGYGKMVEIDHGDGFTTRYAHLSRIWVKVGQRVEKNDRIAASGNTGRSTGPHLHYEVRYKNRPLNPKIFLNAGRRLEPLL